MSRYKISLKWVAIVLKADNEKEAFEKALIQLHDDLVMNVNELMWEIKEVK